MPLGSAFDDEGRCIATDIIIIICSVTKDGSVDPTTCREYQMFCTNCECRTFLENEDMDLVTCNHCKKVAGIKRQDDVC